ncbi:uncharacterized protein LOC127719744 [Mytilus californianus]|uniref:uncharacterized protein LOC127719744 n=1 Tax=Mytilus californianus TaxID=6549 RepID=UPI0022485027|nr:uncharacterized protein LOC127719744 [Mytilus californianus]
MEVVAAQQQSNRMGYINPLIVNGRDVDPMTFRMKWQQYFPPRQDWVVCRRHRTPESDSARNIIKVVISNRIQSYKEKYRSQFEKSEFPAPEKISTMEQKVPTECRSNDSFPEIVTLKDKKIRSRSKKSASKGKVKLKSDTRSLSRQKSDVKCRTTCSDAIEKDGMKQKRKRKIKKSATKKGKHSVKKHISKKDKHELLDINGNCGRRAIDNLHSRESKRPNFTTLPRLPIPDTWKWQGKPRLVEKMTRLPLPTTWKWYDNPNQFKKRQPSTPRISLSSRQSSDVENFSSNQPFINNLRFEPRPSSIL